MKKKINGKFNCVQNGEFIIESEVLPGFPKAWLQIGGNQDTTWKFRCKPMETPVIEINNSTAIRAGIIQVLESALDVRENTEWEISVILKSDVPEVRPYLRIYPIKSDGEIVRPWEYRYNLRRDAEHLKQVVSVSSDVVFLRLEAGILGAGNIDIYKVIACPLSANRMTRRVKKVIKEIRSINHIQTIGEIAKPIQLAMPIPLKVPVNVQANVNADVRNLTATRDRVQICGSSYAPLATSSCGRAQVEIFGHGFHESLENVTATQIMSVTTTRDVSALPRFSFAVYNFGDLLAYVQTELSPDGIHWAFAGEEKKVDPKKLVILSPAGFLRYTRISYWADGSTALRIWVQAQS